MNYDRLTPSEVQRARLYEQRYRVRLTFLMRFGHVLSRLPKRNKR